MDVFLIVVGVFCGAIGILCAIIGVTEGNTQVLFPCLMFTSGCIPFLVVGFRMFWRNQFYLLRNKVNEARANIGRKKSQETELKETLKGLLEQYIKHESKLLDALQSRDYENLAALLEKYPDLKASNTIEKLIGNLVSLRKEITNAETVFNYKLREYQDWNQQTPYRYFKPKDVVDNDYQYIE